MKIDLRSDTVTRPTKEMIECMMSAEVGDDVYKEDSSVNLLEKTLAEMFGMEMALYFPTGTMANQTAIKLLTRPGDEIIADHWSHIYHFEAGGVAFNSGVTCKLLQGNRGMISAEQVEENINSPDFYHSPLTSLVCLENTTNMGGGACYDFDEILKIKEVCKRHDLRLHLDGARIWNAFAAKKENPGDYGKVFDTISVCLSKGLGAPIGSVLLGKKEVMEKAIRIRKILGGGMRQVGYMAAAGIYALENHRNRLVEDHLRAKEIAETLAKLPFVEKVEPTETNIVIFTLTNVNKEVFISKLGEKNIQIGNMGKQKLRIVTHLDYTSSMHEHFLHVLKSLEF